MNAQLVIYKPVTYIGEVFSEFFFYYAPDLYVELTNMYHLRREINQNLQFVAYRLYATEITKFQEWILLKLQIVDR